MRSSMLTLAVLLAATTAAAQTGAPSAQSCAAMTSLQLPGVNLTVTKAGWIPSGPLPAAGPQQAASAPITVPAYCRVDGMIDRRAGAGGVTYGIGFAIALPDAWNGRLLFQGGGGLNGTVQAPIGMAASGGNPGLARGFAVVSTDTGHQGKGAFDASFFQDQQASIDFAYQAVGRVAEVAKRIVHEYYRRPADKSYFAGCSTGGREGMLMAQRYPTYFDGIVVGAPAMRTNFSGIGDRWVAVTLNEVAPKNAQGQPVTRDALSEANKKHVLEGIANACDAGDGLKDGMIFDTRSCRFDPKALVCSASHKAEGCLTAAQAAALEKAFAGPRDSRGRQVYPGFLFDMGIASTQGIPGLLHGGSNPVGPSFTEIGMDVDRAVDTALADAAESLTATSRWTNLNTFSGRGGKLVFYHGVADPWFSALDTIDYYERMTKANGGPEQVRNWSRLFLAPGVGHCNGGPGLDTFDALGAVVNWVEKGVAPDRLTATGRAFPGRSRPLCPYPLHAYYNGSGNPEDAANFSCRP